MEAWYHPSIAGMTPNRRVTWQATSDDEVLSHTRWRGGCVAARGARAAGGEAAYHRILGAGTLSAWSLWVASFVERLREFGWIEGRTVAIEYRWAEGRTERAAEIAAEFVQRNVDVIVTSGTAFVVAAKQATSVIPIVFAAAGDPVGTGLVASSARPGGNITGLSIQQPMLRPSA